MAKDDKKKDKASEDQKDEKKESPADKKGEPSAESEGGQEGEQKPGGGKKKKIILAVIALVAVIAIAIPAVLYLTGKLGKKAAVEGGEVAVENEDGTVGNQAVFYDMEEFIVNLNVGSKKPSFLKMTISLEVANELQIPIVEKNMPRVRDNFQVYLRELRQDDLQGSAGLYRLREELLLRVNKVAYPAKVNDILFKEILVQ